MRFKGALKKEKRAKGGVPYSNSREGGMVAAWLESIVICIKDGSCFALRYVNFAGCRDVAKPPLWGVSEILCKFFHIIP